MDSAQGQLTLRVREMTLTKTITFASASGNTTSQSEALEKAKNHVTQPVSFDDARNLVDRLRLAYPNDTFIAYSDARGWFQGTQLLASSSFCVFKLHNTIELALSEDEVKTKAFVWVSDSKSMSDCQERAKFIYDKTRSTFAGFGLSVLVRDNSMQCYISGPTKGTAYFDKSYGSCVLVILT